MTYNIAKALKNYEAETKEQIINIVVGQHDRRKWDEPPKEDENVLLSREDGLKKLDEDYSNGYGGADCYPMYAWSENYFYTVSEYDGATGVSQWPRNPIACEPTFD